MLKETNLRSDDIKGRVKTYSAIIQGNPIPESTMSESFNVLSKELEGLGLGLSFEKGANNDKRSNVLKIRLKSPDEIREDSYGVITKPETINYKSFKPERGGLFDATIFGPIRDYECFCSFKYKQVKNLERCEVCGVEFTESIVRRYRMAHIELEEPVAHI